MLVVDERGLVRFANPAAHATLGYASDSDLVGISIYQGLYGRYHDDSRLDPFDCPMLRSAATGQSAHAEEWFVRPDGSLLPVEYWSAPISMPGGQGTVVAFTDVSERRRAESSLAAEQSARERAVAGARATELSESDARLYGVLDAALDGVISIDRHGRVSYANAAAQRIFGYPAAELLGQQLADVIVPPSLRDAHRRGLARFLATGETAILDRRIEVTAMRADGSEFPAELTVTPTGRPGSLAFTGFVRDITERRSAERELMASRARLVTASDAARQRVTRDLHDGAQQRFVSTIIGLQLASQKWESDPGQARDLLEAALTDAQQGLKELRDIAAGIHPVLLTRRGLGVALAALAGRLPVPVELQLPEPRMPAAIEESIYFFCSEALTNAVKHGRASCAQVRVAMNDGQCTIEVRDDGIGGAMPRSDTSGLAGLRDRIGALNGAMDIVSPAAGGTVLRASIPLPAEPGS